MFSEDGRDGSLVGHAAQDPGHVSDNDAMMLRIETDPQLRHTITAVIVLDRVPERSALFERVERMSRSAPGYQHRLVTPPLGLATPRWVVDRDFDLSYHVRWIAAPEPKTLDTVLEYARQSAMSGLDRDRPLWTFTVIEGLDGGGARPSSSSSITCSRTAWAGSPCSPSWSTPPTNPATWVRCRRSLMTS